MVKPTRARLEKEGKVRSPRKQKSADPKAKPAKRKATRTAARKAKRGRNKK